MTSTALKKVILTFSLVFLFLSIFANIVTASMVAIQRTQVRTIDKKILLLQKEKQELLEESAQQSSLFVIQEYAKEQGFVSIADTLILTGDDALASL